MVKPNGPGRTQLCVKHPQYKFLNKFTTSAESWQTSVPYFRYMVTGLLLWSASLMLLRFHHANGSSGWFNDVTQRKAASTWCGSNNHMTDLTESMLWVWNFPTASSLNGTHPCVGLAWEIGLSRCSAYLCEIVLFFTNTVWLVQRQNVVWQGKLTPLFCESKLRVNVDWIYGIVI